MQVAPPRIALYGRHSTDKQNPSSSTDQIAACQNLVQFLGGEVVGSYIDAEVSGYRRDRPGLKRLLREIQDVQIDIVVAEPLDRLARDPEDVAWIGKKLRFDRVHLWTISENQIDDVSLLSRRCSARSSSANCGKKFIAARALRCSRAVLRADVLMATARS